MTESEKRRNLITLSVLRSIMTQDIKGILEAHNDTIVKNTTEWLYIDFFLPRIAPLMKNWTAAPFGFLIGLILSDFNEDKDIIKIECAQLTDPEIIESLLNPYERFKFRIWTCPDFVRRRAERMERGQTRAKVSAVHQGKPKKIK